MNETVQFTSGDVSYSVPAMLPPGTWAKNGAILHGVAHLKRRGFFLGYVGDWRSPAGIQEKSDIKWVDQIDKDRPAEPERVSAPNAPDYVPGGVSVPGHVRWHKHGGEPPAALPDVPPAPRDEDLPHYDGSITPESETMERYVGKPWPGQLRLVVDRYVAWQSLKYSGMGPSPFWELVALAERRAIAATNDPRDLLTKVMSIYADETDSDDELNTTGLQGLYCAGYAAGLAAKVSELEKEIESYRRNLEHEFDKREALDIELAEAKRKLGKASALPEAWRTDAKVLLDEFRPMAAVKITCAEELREALK